MSPRMGAALFCGILLLQNLLMFSRHYFGGWMVPWDFLGPYHAVPQFWIEAMQLGVPVSWVPFQAMGYPLYLNLQSGFHYPAFWAFVLSGQPYTAESAIVMQGLHVLFGAIGAALCARLLRLPWRIALLAAVMYQAFGGFYSNASHPDIVRAYALLPWLCAPVLGPWQRSRLLSASLALLPLWTYCLWTGGYSGSTIATLFVLGSVIGARLLVQRKDRVALAHGLIAGLAVAAGTALAGISLLPALLDRAEVARSGAVNFLAFDYLGWKDVLSLISRIDSPYFDHDITMRSLFIGTPALALLLLRPMLGRVRDSATLLALGLLALGMASGVLHRHVIAWVPPLGYSRFVLADYRALIGLCAILLGAQALHLAQESAASLRPGPRRLWLCAMAVFAALALLLPAEVQGTALLRQKGAQFLLVSACLAAAAVWALLKWRPAAPRVQVAAWLVGALMLLAVLDWARVHWGASYFQSPHARSATESVTGPPALARTALAKRLQDPPACRPARIDIPEAQPARIPWRGYYTGDYLSQDYAGPMHLARHIRIRENPSTYAFGLLPWVAVHWPAEAIASGPEILLTRPAASVRCVRYGTTELEYDVDLKEATLIVENEVFSRGWTAQVNGQTLSPVDAHGFRGWALPAGRYRMLSSFHTPHLAQGVWLSGLGLLAWCVLLLALLRMKHD